MAFPFVRCFDCPAMNSRRSICVPASVSSSSGSALVSRVCLFFAVVFAVSANSTLWGETIADDLQVGGNLTVQGPEGLDILGSTLSLGNTEASQPGVSLTFTDAVISPAAPAQLRLTHSRAQSEWVFARPTSGAALKLDASNQLTLYGPTTPFSPVIVLDPAAGQIRINNQPVLTGNITGTGTGSVAFGSSTAASGSYSAAHGIGTSAQAYGSFVAGRYNLISGSTSSWVATDPLFVIGNGVATNNRANAMTILKNGNVGIGTAAPSFLFQVSAGTNQTVATYVPPTASGVGDYSVPGIGYQFSRPTDGGFVHALYSYGTAAGEQNFVASARHSFIISTGNGMQAAPERVRIDAAGRVGIGTSTPAALLQVGPALQMGGDAPTLLISKPAAGSNTVMLVRIGQSTGQLGLDAGNILHLSSELGKGGIDLRTAGSYLAGFASTSVSRLRILDNGNVGIGTVAPTAKLQVRGDVLIGDAPNQIALMPGTAADKGAFFNGQKLLTAGDLSTQILATPLQGIKIGTGASLTPASSSTVQGIMAVGQNARASGLQATALGRNAKAEGMFGFAIGEEASAAGSYSHAIGFQARTSENSANGHRPRIPRICAESG